MHRLIVGGSRAERLSAAAGLETASHIVRLDASTLPFVSPGWIPSPGASARTIRIDDIELAFPNHQSSGTRLVLTQSTYLVQTLIDRVGPNDVIIATADREALNHGARDAFEQRGPWRVFSIVNLDAESARDAITASERGVDAVVAMLAEAYHSASVDERVRLCREAADRDPSSAVAALALSSALRERQDIAGARAALDSALRLAPQWAAAHYEDGKLWLAHEDMERARDSFNRAAMTMPTFAAAFSNLGATLGELDDPEGAADAFARALEHDPDNVTTLNNVGVVNRELGRLDVSEAALTRVTTLAPQFVFGHYNLGHTRFLRGDYRGALAAYEEGQRRDPEQNRRQGCRLALVRFANGDISRAEKDLWRFADAAPPEEREDLLREACEIAHALRTAHPELAADKGFLTRIESALTV